MLAACRASSSAVCAVSTSLGVSVFRQLRNALMISAPRLQFHVLKHSARILTENTPKGISASRTSDHSAWLDA